MDFSEARSWCEKAAHQGFAQAQFDLGVFYLRGQGGLLQDARLAYAWFGVAATQGHQDAMIAREQIGAQLDPTSLAEAR